MKIIVAKSLVQAFLSTAGAVEGSFKIFERDCNEQFAEQFAPKTEKVTAPACLTGTKMKDLEKGSHVEIEAPKSCIPHYNDIKAFASKIGSVTKTDEEITLTINDEFLEDVAEFAGKTVRKCMPLAMQYMKVTMSLAKDVEALVTKWEPKKPQQTEPEIKSA